MFCNCCLEPLGRLGMDGMECQHVTSGFEGNFVRITGLPRPLIYHDQNNSAWKPNQQLVDNRSLKNGQIPNSFYRRYGRLMSSRKKNGFFSIYLKCRITAYVFMEECIFVTLLKFLSKICLNS